jgi:hypothetical protein
MEYNIWYFSKFPIGVLKHNTYGITKGRDDGLVASITKRGILNPIIAFYRNDNYEVRWGHRRVQIAKKLKISTVPVLLFNYELTKKFPTNQISHNVDEILELFRPNTVQTFRLEDKQPIIVMEKCDEL